ncbi:Uncharacterized conserved protein YaaN involved in tellurite resistance [Peptoniphilus asaccharolyticus DSM 20463]|uniref:Uncharacterized conserved protein YaaN involved in tellurite resistance n=1 Tax=Peptoniphilus asaccharolyticus DSM 20463 TaxID=573058 RepID=A0A1W1V410_PEPAS|nr:toxic anion resistance protein [Peptoniphilus asaccharolyticus]MBL7576271.1 toxic anion resistance protein [Peptoniphilus asaccharolyticus]SMB88058.1 Uncharacterized conserved protein YaaN involved in tellurite resistance [Peptoniphilus asaccharolyticus DSM 20463]
MDNFELTLEPNEPKKEENSEILKSQESDIVLTEEEQKKVEEFAKKIDITNSNQVLSYGSGAQNKIASFSEKTLESVYTKDLEEVGNLLSNVVNQLKSFEIEEEEKGLFKFFKKSANKVTAFKTKFTDVEHNVNDVKKALEGHQITLMKDIANLDEMYKLNADYYKELSMYIVAGKKKLADAQNIELRALEDKANASNSPVDAQLVRDHINMINRFEKKLHDLELTKMVSLQMAPQIRMIQSSNTVMLEKLQSTIVNTIPLWKNQMVLALSAGHSLDAARAQKEVTDYTNELLRKNAENIKMATVETQRATERGIVDIETIKYTNEKLIEALNDVKTIQAEGKKKRAEAEKALGEIEINLKKTLMDGNKIN